MKILVINPNSSVPITEKMQLAVADFSRLGAEVVVIRDPQGPDGIKCQADIDFAASRMVGLIRQHEADAYVVGCFSDPGLAQAREEIERPILGIGESSFSLASSLAPRFGILAVVAASVPRHMRYIRQLGYSERLAGDRPIGVTVTSLYDNDILDPVLEAATLLRDVDGAQSLVLGCSGLGFIRQKIEDAIGLPVIDPTQAAVAAAISQLTLGYRSIL
jgi:allantoin racemase